MFSIFQLMKADFIHYFENLHLLYTLIIHLCVHTFSYAKYMFSTFQQNRKIAFHTIYVMLEENRILI